MFQLPKFHFQSNHKLYLRQHFWPLPHHFSNTPTPSTRSPRHFTWIHSKADLHGRHSHLFDTRLATCSSIGQLTKWRTGLSLSPGRWGWTSVSIPQQPFSGLIAAGTVNIWCTKRSGPFWHCSSICSDRVMHDCWQRDITQLQIHRNAKSLHTKFVTWWSVALPHKFGWKDS